MIERLAAFVGMLVVFTLLWPMPAPSDRMRLAWAAAATRAEAIVPESAPPSEAPPSGDMRVDWARDLAGRLGNARPSPEMIRFLVAWTIAEDGGDGAFARNNPLNTTMCGYNMIGSINGDGACGVGHYETYQDGLDATVATLAQGNFSAITAAIQANDPERARAALFASPWAASHYGGGAGWPQ